MVTRAGEARGRTVIPEVHYRDNSCVESICAGNGNTWRWLGGSSFRTGRSLQRVRKLRSAGDELGRMFSVPEWNVV